MPQNNLQLDSFDMAGWLAACGFIFPLKETELAAFDILHGEIDPAITGLEVDPFRIIRNNATVINRPAVRPLYIPASEWRLVAGKPSGPPAHIVKRAKNTEENNTPGKDDSQANRGQ